VAQPSVVVALLTPFGANGDIDLEALRRHVDFLVAEGGDGVSPAAPRVRSGCSRTRRRRR
jgi:dihydrodipicolinate synthase/N-acetylneuraminate lyase